MNSINKNQKGDTIVEVLMALVIIGLAIGIAYGISTRSLKAARQAQERTEAVKIAEGQIERIKGSLNGNNAADITRILDSNSVFCMNSANNAIGFPGPYGTNIPALGSDAFSSYPADCVQGLYKVIVDEEAADQYAVVIRWESLGVGNREEVKIKYRVYP
jgi:prepilin-type N-terminal cleavage/methylation domain-containing protein